MSIEALYGIDYLSTSSYEIFPLESPNGTERCLNILIMDDDILENNESFTVTFTNPDSEITLGRTTTVITIIDDDSNARSFVKTTYPYYSYLTRCYSIYSKNFYCL